ncbi:MAG TPA: hypothetical protein VFV17_09740 [Usitatibacteraceae bacterium]|nr:hypothetical protein [Usitatibacteraceae bacterium]
MRHRTVLEYRHYRYLKLAVAIVVAAALGYALYSSPVGRYGGTITGYVLGTVGALIILLLLWFGIQKRRYRTAGGNLQGWLSAHVYLGTTLIVVATLHSGFQVGWNVHTLAYVLMLAVIFSGFYGMYAYIRIPKLMTANLGDDSLDSLVLKIADIDREARRLAMSMPDSINKAVSESIAGTRIGGGVLAQLRGRVRGCPTDRAVDLCKSSVRELKGDAAKTNTDLYAMLLRKQQLVARARLDVRYKAVLEFWLFFHVPLSIALLGALTAHVIAVFFYW